MTEKAATADAVAAADTGEAAADEAAVAADTVPGRAKCTMRPAQAAGRRARCRSSHQRAGPCIAGTATRRTGPRATITK